MTAADQNASFAQIVNNGTDVAFPLTKNGAAGGFIFTGLGAGTAAGHSVRYEQLLGALNSVNDFRLSLTTAVPVTTADVTGATTVYCTPKTGNRIALYDGSTQWNVRTSAEFSLALGTLTSGLPYDVFCYDNGGTPTLEFLVWTNDTTRATALTTQNGVLVKTGALTRRYLGTFYTTAATTTEDSLAKRFLWNYYNRTRRPMQVIPGGSWTYAVNTIRQANATASNQLDMVIGYGEDVVSAMVGVLISNSAIGNGFRSSIGLDSTTTIHASCLGGQMTAPQAGGANCLYSHLKIFPGVGRHFLSWNETSGAGTTTSGGFNNESGIHGELLG